jgi:Na+-transporting methylmalonyl-CoA/oxaloacetate decarboxylase beta subunit
MDVVRYPSKQMPTMFSSAISKNLIQYTSHAATTAKQIADSSQVPFLGSTAVLTLSILKSVEVIQFVLRWYIATNSEQNIRSYKNECVQMVEQIYEIICAILKLYTTSETNGVLSTALLYDIGKFTE